MGWVVASWAGLIGGDKVLEKGDSTTKMKKYIHLKKKKKKIFGAGGGGGWVHPCLLRVRKSDD